MKIQDIETVKRLLDKQPKISIIPHKNPDGDAMGSCLGLWHYLKNQGLDAVVVAPNDYPENLKWLPGTESVVVYDLTPEIATKQIEKSQLIFTLDFNSLDRADVLTPLLAQSKADFVMIDHHQMPQDYARVTFSNPTASSTCAMVYGLLDAMGSTNLITKNIATCLYTGIMTDTGNFKFATTTANTLRIAAALIDKGAENATINDSVYDTNSYDRIQLLSTALKNMVYLPQYNASYITLTSEEMIAHNFKQGDTEGIVNYGLGIKGTKLAVIFIEYKDKGFVKMSLRSKGNVDVNTIARTHFNGGGHINAAGGRFDGTLEEAVSLLLKILSEHNS